MQKPHIGYAQFLGFLPLIEAVREHTSPVEGDLMHCAPSSSLLDLAGPCARHFFGPGSTRAFRERQ